MIEVARDRFCDRLSKPASPEALPPSLAIIETRILIRECLSMCLQRKLGRFVLSYPDVTAWSEDPAGACACVVILSGVGPHIEREQRKLFQELALWDRDIPVVVFSDDERRNQILTSLRSGARGYMPSGIPLEMVARGIKLVLVGGVFVPANLLVGAEQEVGDQTEENGKERFSPRENEVVKALLRGGSNKVIAYELGMSESSVKTHMRNVMRKLQVNNRTEAVVRIVESQRADVAATI